MNTYQDIKQKFEAISSQLEPMLTSLPKEVSLLFTLLLTMFHALFEMTSRQNKELREAIDNQTKTINKQTRQIQTLRHTLERERRENREIPGTARGYGESAQIQKRRHRLPEPPRVRGRHRAKKEKPEPAPADADQTDASEKPAGKKKSEKRNRQSNGEKTENCDVEINRYLTSGGDVLSSETEEDASIEIAQEAVIGGKKCRFRGWKKSGGKVEIIKKTAHVTTYVPIYVAEEGETLEGINPEKDFLPKTVFGFSLMADASEERMQNRIPMNKIAGSFGMRCGFAVSRQPLARYFMKSAEWIRSACECLCEQVLGERVIHLDETFMHCREEEDSRQYAPVFTSDRGCFFRYANSRSQTVPLRILENHCGGIDRWTDKNGDGVIISTDGWYDGDWLKNPDGTHKAELVGSLTHLRRYFWEICRAHENHIDPASEDYIMSDLIAEMLGEIFHLDKQCAAPPKSGRKCAKPEKSEKSSMTSKR